MLGVWIEPVTAQLMMTLFAMTGPPLTREDRSLHRDGPPGQGSRQQAGEDRGENR